MAGDNRSIQVLNISNVNAEGDTVLNDGRLLELVQKYPFLYNKRVKGYNDSDYTEWAWKNISAAFNSSYGNDPNAAFSTGCLVVRWNVLKPLIQCLSKAYDMEAIPPSLRSSIIRISTELDDKNCGIISKPYTPGQQLLSQHMTAIGELPIDKRLALEREILNFILSTERESKHLPELNEADLKEVYENTEELMNDIGYKQVLLAAVTRQEKIFYNSHAKSRTLGWIPLDNVDKMIKPCHIRMQRINIEDYLPLSQIIQMNKTKE